MAGIVAFILVLSLVQAVQSQRVSSVTFSIAAANRLAFSTNTDATFSFITSATSNLAPDSTITLNYPVDFFTSAVGLGVQISGSVTGSAGTPSSTSITINIATGTIGQSTAVTVTLTGLTMGAVTAGGNVTVQTSADFILSAAAVSGVIGGAVTAVTFGVASGDRVAGKTGSKATFSFKTTAGGALAVGDKITLTYPLFFFSPTGTPGVAISGGGATGTVATPTSTQIIITIATQALAASTAVTVTVTGLTMGAATAGSSNGVTIATSVDQTVLFGVSSGSIGNQVTSTSAPTSSTASGESSFLDLIMQDPNFPYYAAGASAHILNVIAVAVVCCCKALRLGVVVTAILLAIFFNILAWIYLFFQLKRHTGNYCCFSASTSLGASLSFSASLKQNKGKKESAIDAIMAKHKRDFFARHGHAVPSVGEEGNHHVSHHDVHHLANGRPFFMPFGMQQIPGPYGPPLPTPYMHARHATTAGYKASGVDALTDKKERGQKMEEGKEKAGKDAVADKKDKKDDKDKKDKKEKDRNAVA